MAKVNTAQTFAKAKIHQTSNTHRTRKSRRAIVMFMDGGCRPNPGMMRCCVAIARVPPKYIYRQFGYGTNNIAEWGSLLFAMQLAIDGNFQIVQLYSDSQLVVNQAMGRWAINDPDLRKFFTKFKAMRKKISRFHLEYVPRDQNLAGKYLERRG